MQEFITAKREEIAELCRTHHVKRLAVFGSAVRDDFDPTKSDVDVRVEFLELDPVTYAANYFELQGALANLFERQVDLLSSTNIRNPYFKKELEATQELLYAA